MKKFIGDLRQLAALKAGEITPLHGRLLSEAANHIDLLMELLRQREQEADKWRRRAVEAENKIRLRITARKG
jgi:hypothetical protein